MWCNSGAHGFHHFFQQQQGVGQHLQSQADDKSESPPSGHNSLLPGLIGQHVNAQCNLQASSPALGTVIKVIAERLIVGV